MNLTLLARALDQTGTLIAAITPSQADLPTPCASWDVRALVNHVVDEVHQFAVITGGGERNHLGVDVLGASWPDAFAREAAFLLAEWGRPGVLERTVTLPFGEVTAEWVLGQQIAELAGHAWDIARSTGQSVDLDGEVGEAAYAWMREVIRPEFRGAEEDGYHMGPETVVGEDAALYDRIAAYGGRAV
ncbi:TIGR03086 family metal-binding protein [Nonomuraea sp. NPDC050556]|uniref:TIGR03086 family metal-binding protein n=1 Tax=Nonomuraea sp. NPDC050556 TaxID=3364369 RepID=UPI003797F032